MAEKNADQTLFSEFDALPNEAWKNLAIRDLKGGDFNRKLVWSMENELSVAPFYTKEDLANLLTITQRATENIVLSQESGSMLQRIQAEFMQELMKRIEALQK